MVFLLGQRRKRFCNSVDSFGASEPHKNGYFPKQTKLAGRRSEVNSKDMQTVQANRVRLLAIIISFVILNQQ